MKALLGIVAGLAILGAAGVAAFDYTTNGSIGILPCCGHSCSDDTTSCCPGEAAPCCSASEATSCDAPSACEAKCQSSACPLSPGDGAACSACPASKVPAESKAEAAPATPESK